MCLFLSFNNLQAHALSIQTGCEILVKLHDVTDQTDTNSHQYYATGNLHKAYKDNTLRKHPKEKLVCGETGLPQNVYIDQAVQSGDNSEDVESPTDHESVPAHDNFTTEQSQQYIANDDSEGIPLPLHLTVTNEPNVSGNELPEAKEPPDDNGEGVEDNEQGPLDVKIKVEKVEDELQETPMISETLDTSVQSTESETFTDFHQSESMDSVPAGAVQDDNQLMDRFSMPMSPKPYQCAMCGKAFRSVQVLQKHTRTFHFRGQGSPAGQGSSRGQGLMSSLRGRGRGQTTPIKR